MIIVPAYYTSQTPWLLTQLLNSLIHIHTDNILGSVAIIDDGSLHKGKASGYAELLKLFPKVHIFQLQENKGYSHSVNYGITFAKSLIERGANIPFVITINPDIEMISGFMEHIVRVFRADPKIAVVGAKLLFPNGQIQHAGFELVDTDFYVAANLYDRNKYTLTNPGDSDTSRFVMGVTGAFQAIRMSAIDEIGMYSEDYFLAYEDVEFCLRTWQHGYRVFYCSDIQAVHAEGATRGSGVTATELRSMQQAEKDVKKHDVGSYRNEILRLNQELLK